MAIRKRHELKARASGEVIDNFNPASLLKAGRVSRDKISFFLAIFQKKKFPFLLKSGMAKRKRHELKARASGGAQFLVFSVFFVFCKRYIYNFYLLYIYVVYTTYIYSYACPALCIRCFSFSTTFVRTKKCIDFFFKAFYCIYGDGKEFYFHYNKFLYLFNFMVIAFTTKFYSVVNAIFFIFNSFQKRTCECLPHYALRF